ncbi:MAG TPA: MFS transporter [Thermoflexales bacterium]|nr:MFS transporter [Thermoflexales bacterium]HQX11634.1 MFS transporter [Thermoflexales bacterium]HQY26457.1 MFS transporter [Thermoflexales bacterium]HQZ54271.1 MFS transporter [Thermoflexales bacterium]HRA54937.1 MFS transporter [Thermoflexales bacterium]
MTDKLDFKRVLPIFVIVLVDLLGLTIIIPLLSLYAATFKADALTIGVLAAAYPLAQFIGAPILGRLSDRFGRRPVLIFSQVGTLIGLLVLGFANTLPVVFLSRIIDGLSGANISTAQAVIADSTNEKTRTQGLGLIGAAFGLGFTVGPLIAFIALGASGNNYRVPAFVAAGFSAVSILLSLFWLKETRPEGYVPAAQRTLRIGSLKSALTHPGVGLLLILISAQQIAFGGFEQILPLFALSRLGLNASAISGMFIFLGILIVVIQGGLIRQWSRRFGDRWLVLMGLVTLSVGLVLVAFTPAQPPPFYDRAAVVAELTASPDPAAAEKLLVPIPVQGETGYLGLAWILLAFIPATIGGSVLQPTINSFLTKRVDKGEIGGILGISASLVSLANAAGPLIGGALFRFVSPTATLLFQGLLMAALLPFAIRTLRGEERPNTGTKASELIAGKH